MDINWTEVVITAGILYGLMLLQYWYKVFRYRRRKPAPKLEDDVALRGMVKNAAAPIFCGRCGAPAKSYAVYADDSTWCMNCHEFED